MTGVEAAEAGNVGNARTRQDEYLILQKFENSAIVRHLVVFAISLIGFIIFSTNHNHEAAFAATLPATLGLYWSIQQLPRFSQYPPGWKPYVFAGTYFMPVYVLLAVAAILHLILLKSPSAGYTFFVNVVALLDSVAYARVRLGEERDDIGPIAALCYLVLKVATAYPPSTYGYWLGFSFLGTLTREMIIERSWITVLVVGVRAALGTAGSLIFFFQTKAEPVDDDPTLGAPAAWALLSLVMSFVWIIISLPADMSEGQDGGGRKCKATAFGIVGVGGIMFIWIGSPMWAYLGKEHSVAVPVIATTLLMVEVIVCILLRTVDKRYAAPYGLSILYGVYIAAVKLRDSIPDHDAEGNPTTFWDVLRHKVFAPATRHTEFLLSADPDLATSE